MVRYILARIEVKDGERVYEIPFTKILQNYTVPEYILNMYAKEFYGTCDFDFDPCTHDFVSYSFFNEEVVVTIKEYCFISRAQYNVLNKLHI